MIVFPEHLEHSFLQLAEIEHKPVSTLIEQALTEFLEDHHDARLAELAIKEVQNGESELLSLDEAKQLYDKLAH